MLRLNGTKSIFMKWWHWIIIGVVQIALSLTIFDGLIPDVIASIIIVSGFSALAVSSFFVYAWYENKEFPFLSQILLWLGLTATIFAAPSIHETIRSFHRIT